MANKRRQRSDTAPLGATEFAAALNGDDPNAIYRCLKQFVRSVRRERDKALGLNASSQESSSSSDDEEETVIHANKKLKKVLQSIMFHLSARLFRLRPRTLARLCQANGPRVFCRRIF
jgi:hypothetical protein